MNENIHCAIKEGGTKKGRYLKGFLMDKTMDDKLLYIPKNKNKTISIV